MHHILYNVQIEENFRTFLKIFQTMIRNLEVSLLLIVIINQWVL